MKATVQQNDCLFLAKQALEQARLALAACHGCLTTDRPDLPLGPDTSWTIDNSREVDLIGQALDVISTDIGRE